MRDNWQMFSGELDDKLCDDIISNFEKLEPETATTFNNAEDYRKSKIRWVSHENGLKDFLMRYIEQANSNAWHINIDRSPKEMQFTEYSGEYEGKYDWHHDIFWESPKNYDRKLSVVVQLSDPDAYEGGNFEFSEVANPDQSALRARGTILVFPSYLEHRVTAITEGTRYSLVLWVSGPRWV